jgi:hypothetical protein
MTRTRAPRSLLNLVQIPVADHERLCLVCLRGLEPSAVAQLRYVVIYGAACSYCLGRSQRLRPRSDTGVLSARTTRNRGVAQCVFYEIAGLLFKLLA